MTSEQSRDKWMQLLLGVAFGLAALWNFAEHNPVDAALFAILTVAFFFNAARMDRRDRNQG